MEVGKITLSSSSWQRHRAQGLYMLEECSTTEPRALHMLEERSTTGQSLSPFFTFNFEIESHSVAPVKFELTLQPRHALNL